MPKVAVLVPCSSSKTVEALAGARAASLPQGPQRSVEAAWLGQLRGLEGVRPARDLYDGRAFGIAREACELWRQDIDCRLYIVSAGLGLMPSPAPVPSYGVSVSAKGEEDIRARVAGKFDPAAWWKAVSGGPYAVPLDEALADGALG